VGDNPSLPLIHFTYAAVIDWGAPRAVFEIEQPRGLGVAVGPGLRFSGVFLGGADVKRATALVQDRWASLKRAASFCFVRQGKRAGQIGLFWYPGMDVKYAPTRVVVKKQWGRLGNAPAFVGAEVTVRARLGDRRRSSQLAVLLRAGPHRPAQAWRTADADRGSLGALQGARYIIIPAAVGMVGGKAEKQESGDFARDGMTPLGRAAKHFGYPGGRLQGLAIWAEAGRRPTNVRFTAGKRKKKKEKRQRIKECAPPLMDSGGTRAWPCHAGRSSGWGAPWDPLDR